MIPCFFSDCLLVLAVGLNLTLLAQRILGFSIVKALYVPKYSGEINAIEVRPYPTMVPRGRP